MKSTDFRRVTVPFERFEKLCNDAYCAHILAEQSSEIKSIPFTLNFEGNLVFSTGYGRGGISTPDGKGSSAKFWVITPLEQYRGRVFETMHDEGDIQAGVRERGDAIGSHVKYRGKDYVISSGIILEATWPSKAAALSMSEFEVAKKDEIESGRFFDVKQNGHLIQCVCRERYWTDRTYDAIFYKSKGIQCLVPRIEIPDLNGIELADTSGFGIKPALVKVTKKMQDLLDFSQLQMSLF